MFGNTNPAPFLTAVFACNNKQLSAIEGGGGLREIHNAIGATVERECEFCYPQSQCNTR
jgi:hypothetical protein